MFLYVLIFLNSCLSTKSRQISSVESNEKIWYLGFDKRLKNQEQDSSWSPKLYYSPALDNLRKFGNYSYTEKNDQREYLKDRFNKEGHSLYPTLEKLLLVLFPSPFGSLSIISSSDTNINTYISRLHVGVTENNSLTKEFALAKILNTAHSILSLSNLSTNEKNKDKINNLREKLLSPIEEIFSKYYRNNQINFINTDLKISTIIRNLFNPLLNFVSKDIINSAEQELIQHAFMKWALMHVDITNTKSIDSLINQLIFFEKDQEHNNSHQQDQLSETEKLFQKAQIGIPQSDNIYLTNDSFSNGSTYAFDDKGFQTDKIFPDCTETTIRHFFNYALKRNGTYHVLKSFNVNLQEYYKDANDKKVLGSDIKSRTAWNKVVSHIPGAEYNRSENDLKSNISNILHVIEYLLTNEKKPFKTLSSQFDIEEKFKSISVILNKIKPITLTKYNETTKTYIYEFNSFFIINIDHNSHSYVTLEKNSQTKTMRTNVKPDKFNSLEYSLLTNFFTFKDQEASTIKKDIIPLFYSSINDITTILNFFKKSNEQDETHLNTFSSYIGRVLGSAVWEDNSIVSDIYKDENLINLIKIVKKPENILQGVKLLSLEFGEFKSIGGFLTEILKEKLLSLKGLQIIYIDNFLSDNLQDLDQVVINNNKSIKKIRITNMSQMDERLKPILSCIHLKELEITKSPFELTSRLSDLMELELLHISNTKNKKTIPNWLMKLTKLNRLILPGNNFSGSIPSWLSQLINLKELCLSFNSFTGKIPNELKTLKKLTDLNLSDNKLSGPIPKWLEELVHLEYLRLHNNKLEQSIPKELGKLTQLVILTLAQNKLTGTIPFELSNLTKLWALILSKNNLTGSIPEELGNSPRLKNIDFSLNNLTGFIPKNLKKYSENINPQIKIIRGKEIEYNLFVDYK
jgi:hypothetical protein